jgi:hypothetical protein
VNHRQPATSAIQATATVITAVAYTYLLGRLKLLYYYDCFGIDWASLGVGPADLFFESWFPLQQLLFAGLIGWLAIKSRSVAVSIVALLYALLPIGAHYAFLAPPNAAWSFLIDYRHSLLKMIPFLILAVLCLLPEYRRRLARRSPSTHAAVRWVALIVLLSWGISTAKHSGSYDANRVVRDPSLLPRVTIEGQPYSYLLHAGPRTLILWDGQSPSEDGELRTLEIPRDSQTRIERRKSFHVQPGGQYL